MNLTLSLPAPTRLVAWKKGLSDLEIRVACNTDSTCYEELLAELKSNEAWRGRRTYNQVQRRTGLVWAAIKAYRQEQRDARTPSASPIDVAASVPAHRECPMCNDFFVPAFEDQDYCSYHCASGGGGSVNGSCKICGREGRRSQLPYMQPTCCSAAARAHLLNRALKGEL